jgi:hypothetical protein
MQGGWVFVCDNCHVQTLTAFGTSVKPCIHVSAINGQPQIPLPIAQKSSQSHDILDLATSGQPNPAFKLLSDAEGIRAQEPAAALPSAALQPSLTGSCPVALAHGASLPENMHRSVIPELISAPFATTTAPPPPPHATCLRLPATVPGSTSTCTVTLQNLQPLVLPFSWEVRSATSSPCDAVSLGGHGSKLLRIHPCDGVLGELEEVTFDVVFAPEGVENIQRRFICWVDPSWASGTAGAKAPKVQALELLVHGSGAKHPAMAVPQFLLNPAVAVVGDCMVQALRLINPCRAPANFTILGAGPEVHAVPGEGCIPPHSAIDVSVETVIDNCCPVATTVTCAFEHGAVQCIQVLVPRLQLPELRVNTAPIHIDALRLGNSKTFAVALFNPSSHVALAWHASETPPPSSLPLRATLSVGSGAVELKLRERPVSLSLETVKGSVAPGDSAAVVGMLTAIAPGSYSSALAITSETYEYRVGIFCQVVEPRLVLMQGTDCLALGNIYQAIPQPFIVSFTNVSKMPAEWSARNGGCPIGCHSRHVSLIWSSTSGSVAPGEVLRLEMEVTVATPGAVDVLFALDVCGCQTPIVQQLTAHCIGLQVEFHVLDSGPGEGKKVMHHLDVAGRVVDFGSHIPIRESRSKWLRVRNCGGIAAPVRFWVNEFPGLQARRNGLLLQERAHEVLVPVNSGDNSYADAALPEHETSQNYADTQGAAAGQLAGQGCGRRGNKALRSAAKCAGTPVGIRLGALHESEAPFWAADGNRIIMRRHQLVNFCCSAAFVT